MRIVFEHDGRRLGRVERRSTLRQHAQAGLGCAAGALEIRRRIGVDATKGIPQNAEVGRLEPVMLARPIEPHHGAAIGHADDRHCRLPADFHIIRHQSSSFRPSGSRAGKRTCRAGPNTLTDSEM